MNENTNKVESTKHGMPKTIIDLISYAITQLSERGYRATHIFINNRAHQELYLTNAHRFYPFRERANEEIYNIFGLKATIINIKNDRLWLMVIDEDHAHLEKDALEAVEIKRTIYTETEP